MWVRRPLLGGGCILFASSEVKVVNKKIFAGFVSLILVSKISCASAQQFGTAEEARAMLDHAIAALKSWPNSMIPITTNLTTTTFMSSASIFDGKITAY
jgi:hypothetical protein